MAQTLAELWKATAPTVESQPWPENGAEYELFVAKMPECDDAAQFLDLPADLANLFSEIGRGQCMTSDLFLDDQIIEEAGLWKVKIRYSVEFYRDWETGHSDPEFLLEVLAKEKI